MPPLFLIAQENTPIACADGIDNDGDGLIDCLDSDCAALTMITDGCTICMNDGLSFADTVIASEITCPTNEHTNPQQAIGMSNSTVGLGNFPAVGDVNDVSLGENGSITLGFTNNLLVNSGDSNPDIWVFETGPFVERCRIELRPYDQSTIDILIAEGIPDIDADGFFDFGNLANRNPSKDIDAIVSGYFFFDLKFDAIQITDVVDTECVGSVPGPDIDAVCALTSVPFDCAGVPNGMAIVDSCGICLEQSDPNFNQSCSDCSGIPNGTAIIDNCSVCLEPNDPNFDQSCIDCAGVLNGTMMIDECGICLEQIDPNFSQSCSDCAGIPNGMATIDNCGVCLEPNDPSFNQSCIDCAGMLNGTMVLDECGVCLEQSDTNFNQSCSDCAGIPNGIAMIDNCGVCLEPNDPSFNQSCIDCAGILNGTMVLDECGVCLEPSDPDFNTTCIDCEGIVNGTKRVDNCGVCLESTDPNFNRSCLDKNTIYIPNTFSPNSDGINDTFQVFKDMEVNAYIKEYLVFNRWGSLLYEAKDFEFDAYTNWWDGEFRGEKMEVGVYIYYIEIEFENNKIKKYGGDIGLLR